MLAVKDGASFSFVGSNKARDEYEAANVVMYDNDPFTNVANVAFDGKKWLVPKISVEPEQE